jgi:hypothetical protein
VTIVAHRDLADRRRTVKLGAAVLGIALALAACSSGPRNPRGIEVECWNNRALGDQIGPLADSARTHGTTARRIKVLAARLGEKAVTARADLESNGAFRGGDDCARDAALIEGLVWSVTSSPVPRHDADTWYRVLLDFYPNSPFAPEAMKYLKDHVPNLKGLS